MNSLVELMQITRLLKDNYSYQQLPFPGRSRTFTTRFWQRYIAEENTTLYGIT